MIVLEALKNLLKCGAEHFVKNSENGMQENVFLSKFDELGGVQKLEALQQHPNENVYVKTVNILETFYESTDEILDDVLLPNTIGMGQGTDQPDAFLGF